MAERDPLEPVCPVALVALQGEADQAVAQLWVRDAVRLEQLREHARGGEAWNRVDLVYEHLAAIAHEEVAAGKSGSAYRLEDRRRELAESRRRLLADPGRNDEIHPPLRVLGLVVVPVGVGDDLARG